MPDPGRDDPAHKGERLEEHESSSLASFEERLARARGGQVPHRAGHRQVAIVGRGNPRLQDFPARGHARVAVHRPFEGSVSIHLKRNDRTTGPGQSSQRSPLQSSPSQSLNNW